MKRLEDPSSEMLTSTQRVRERETQLKKKIKFFTVNRIKPLCIIILFLESVKRLQNKLKEVRNVTNKLKVIFLQIFLQWTFRMEKTHMQILCYRKKI